MGIITDSHNVCKVMGYYNTVDIYIHYHIQCYTNRGFLECGLWPETLETCCDKPNANINLMMKFHELI